MPTATQSEDLIRRMRSRYAGRCQCCGMRFPTGADIVWERAASARTGRTWIARHYGAQNGESALRRVPRDNPAGGVVEQSRTPELLAPYTAYFGDTDEDYVVGSYDEVMAIARKKAAKGIMVEVRDRDFNHVATMGED